MTASVTIKAELVDSALAFGEADSKRGVVKMAMKELVNARNMLDLIEFMKTVEYDEDYDYKAVRQKK
jgi:hypothetical protein